jgi:hypothetical protein
MGPKTASMAPGGYPRRARMYCMAATSQPRSPFFMVRLPKAGRPRLPNARLVWGPTTPSTDSPRRRWKLTIAALVTGPRTPSTVAL